MARRPHSFTEEDFESLEGRASKTEQKKAVQRMASLGSQLAELNTKQIQLVVANFYALGSCCVMKMKR